MVYHCDANGNACVLAPEGSVEESGGSANDVLNCSDFSTQTEAQQTYEYTLNTYGYDVHRLDADSDCIACEHLSN